MNPTPPGVTEAPLSKLIHALREELKHYGELLALLDQQQECAINRLADELLHCTGAVQRQASLLQEARRDREQRQRALADALCLTGGATFAELLPRLPADYQPLVDSLVAENNALLARIQQRARQNHLVLSRSVELMHRFMNTLFPACETQVYDGRGSRQSHTVPTPPLYEAVG